MAGVSPPEGFREIPAGRVARGRVAPPPSKSVTHRYLNLALLAGAPAAIAPAAAGRGHPPLPRRPRGAGLVGGARGRTAARLCAARRHIATPGRRRPTRGPLLRQRRHPLPVPDRRPHRPCPGSWRVDGTPRLRERPVGPLVGRAAEPGRADRVLGAAGHAPLTIRAGGPAGRRGARLDAGESSQYLSALLMAGLAGAGADPDRGAAPHLRAVRRAHPRAIRRFLSAGRRRRSGPESSGGDLATSRRLSRSRRPTSWRSEGDWSAACYPAAAAALDRRPGASWWACDRVVGPGRPARSSTCWRRWAPRSPGRTTRSRSRGGRGWRAGRWRSTCRRSAGPGADPGGVGAVCPRDDPHLQCRALADQGERPAAGHGGGAGRGCGVPVEERPDGLVIDGCWAGRASAAGTAGGRPVVLDPVGDHRIAMSFALVGLRRARRRVAAPGGRGQVVPRLLGRPLRPARRVDPNETGRRGWEPARRASPRGTLRAPPVPSRHSFTLGIAERRNAE